MIHTENTEIVSCAIDRYLRIQKVIPGLVVNGVRLLLLTRVNRDRNIFSIKCETKTTLFTSRFGPSSPSFKYM